MYIYHTTSKNRYKEVKSVFKLDDNNLLSSDDYGISEQQSASSEAVLVNALLQKDDVNRLASVNIFDSYIVFSARKEVSSYLDHDGTKVKVELTNWSYSAEPINLALVNFKAFPIVLPYDKEESIEVRVGKEYISLKSDLTFLVYKLTDIEEIRTSYFIKGKSNLSQIKDTHYGQLCYYLDVMYCKVHQLQREWSTFGGSFYSYAIYQQLHNFMIGDIIVSGKANSILDRLDYWTSKVVRKLSNNQFGRLINAGHVTKFKNIFIRR